MTIQVLNCNKNKQVLEAALNTNPDSVNFEDPSIFNPRSFTGTDIKPGEGFAVVMDHPRRSRFASIKRKQDGTFKVG